MLTVCLQRKGRTHRTKYRIVLKQKHPRKIVQIMGFYDPVKKDLQVNSEQIKQRLQQNVEFSDTCYNILVKNKIIEGQARVPNKNSKAKKKQVN